MRVELLPGMTNVVRFPVGRRARPTVGLLRDIAPDVRVVLNLVEAFGMELPVHDLRDRTDEATAQHIAENAPVAGDQRGSFLNELLAIAAGGAIAACRDAREAALAASDAQTMLGVARTAGSYWVAPLEERAEALTERAAVLLLTAHAEAEQAEGVARAVDLARRGESWTPRDGNADMEFLIAVHRAAS